MASDAQHRLAATPLPTRATQLQALQEKHFDILVIGGGATGCGVALDAASRGITSSDKYSDNNSSNTRTARIVQTFAETFCSQLLILDLVCGVYHQQNFFVNFIMLTCDL